MNEELKDVAEFSNDDTKHIDSNSSCKKYVKLVLPHVLLVAVVCLYAIAGAWVFYSLESPHEDKLKKIGIQKISELRKELVQTLWTRRKELQKTEMHKWARVTDVKLQTFNEYLYTAFKEHYIRYADIRIFKTNISKRSANEKLRRYRRKSKYRPKSFKSKKLWTASSAIFFAATTMATIGYGNIVPVTSYGRIACVVFALFGVPLAIITIGDLGKFLSECTIWFYKKMRKLHYSLKCYLINLRRQNARNPELRSLGKSDKAVNQLPNCKDFALDKAEVPLIFVFAILLFYIAFGGLLFASLEPWTYTDAFYFCFVSLTTIGFGDLVPESQEYVVLMLMYLGFGLAVTTMCIDLVGIQYIQKIHYFGRKFRTTDLLQLIKRKQMIEHGLTADQSDELLELYLRQFHKAGNVSTKDSRWHECNNASELPIPVNHDISDDNNNGDLQCIEIPDISDVEHKPIIYHVTTSTQSSLKSLMFHNERNNSKESISKSDNQMIASISPIRKSSSLSQSLPMQSSQQQLLETKSSTVSLTNQSSSNSPIGLSCMMGWDSYIEMINESNKPFVRVENRATEMFLDDSTITKYENEYDLIEHEEIISQKHGIISQSSQLSSSTLSSINYNMQITRPSKLDLDICETVESISNTSRIPSPEQNIQQSIVYYENIPIHSLHQKTVETENVLQNLFDAPETIIGHQLPPAVVDDNYCFVIDGETIGLEAMLHDDIHWSHTSRPTQYYYSDDLRNFHRVNCIKAKGKIIAMKIIGSQARTFNTLRSSRSTPIRQSRSSVHSFPSSSISSINSFRRDALPFVQVYVVTRIYSFWKTCPSFRRIITLVDRIDDSEMKNIQFQKRIFVQHIWRNTKQSDKDRVKREFNRDCARHAKSKIKRSTKFAFS